MEITVPPATSAPLSASPTPTETPSRGAARVRYIGVDLARFLAIVGMMATHLLVAGASAVPGSPEFVANEVTLTVAAGTSAALFAVLGGVSMVLAARRRIAEGRTGAAIGAIVVRALIVILIGLLLGGIVSPVVVVLAYYGVAMLLVAPLIAAPGWLLASIALVLGIASGPLNALARQGLGVVNEGGSVNFELLGADPLSALRALFLTGEYPAVTWAVYLIVGVLAARALVAATARGSLARVAGTLAASGAVLATVAQLVSMWALANRGLLGATPVPGVDEQLVSQLLTAPTFGAPFGPELWAQLIATPHSGSPLDLARTIGIALAVIGLLVLVFDALLGARRPGPVLGTIRAAGAAPLTVYTLHIVATGLTLGPLLEQPELLAGGMPWWAMGLSAFGLQLAGVLVIGAVLAALGRRGPLEAITSGAVNLLVRSGRAPR